MINWKYDQGDEFLYDRSIARIEKKTVWLECEVYILESELKSYVVDKDSLEENGVKLMDKQGESQN